MEEEEREKERLNEEKAYYGETDGLQSLRPHRDMEGQLSPPPGYEHWRGGWGTGTRVFVFGVCARVCVCWHTGTVPPPKGVVGWEKLWLWMLCFTAKAVSFEKTLLTRCANRPTGVK